MKRTITSERPSHKPRQLLRLALAGVLALSALLAAHPPAPVHATFPGSNGLIAYLDGNDIATMNADGTGRTVLAVGTLTVPFEYPSWSSDGTQIAFDDTTTIYVMRADGSGLRSLGSLPGATHPSWSPDSTRLAFLVANGGPLKIDVVNADGTNRHTVMGGVNIQVNFSGPSWSPDGQRIAAAAAALDAAVIHPGIATVAPTGGSVTFVDPNGISWGDESPEWSPDGKHLVFIRFQPNLQRDVYRINADGTGLTLLTPAHLDKYLDPVWSPDGALIAVDNGADIFTMNATDGSTLTRLTTSGVASEPSWSVARSNTPLGNPIVSPVDAATGTSPVTLSFTGVTKAGNTTLTISATGPPAPSGFSLGSPPKYFLLNTTAIYGSVIVCIVDPSVTAASRLLHFDAAGIATDVTGTVTPPQICSGPLTSLSPFTIATVTPQLVSLAVTPANSSLAKGLNSQFTATGTYTDGSTKDLTSTSTWSSSATAVGTISAAGLAHAVDLGTTTITASNGSISAGTGLTITDAQLVSLAVTPANSSLAKGLNSQFTATGTYTDASTKDLTASSTWSSSATAVASISAAGLAHAVDLGTTTITAGNGSISAATGLTVTPADQSLTITRIGALAFRLEAAAGVIFKDADPNGNVAQLSAIIDWGDHNAPSAIGVSRIPFLGVFVAGGLHHYSEPGTYAITVTVNDVQGATTSGSTTVTVHR